MLSALDPSHHAQYSALAVVVLMCASLTSGCGFARSGMPIPPDHPRLRGTKVTSLPSCSIPGCYPEDPTDTSLSNFVPNSCGGSRNPACGNWQHLQSAGFISSLVRLADHYKTDLCYWEFGQLPPPPNSELNFTDAGASMIYELGEAANAELHQLIGKGPFEGGIATSGNLVNRNLCERGVLKGRRCDPLILNSAGPVPAAVPMLRVAAPSSTRNATEIIKDIDNNVTAWRRSSSLHGPNIDWAAKSHWGDSGSMVFKVVKCNDVPLGYRAGTKNCQPDSLTDDGKESFYNANLRTWQQMESLCPPSRWVTGGNTPGCGVPAPSFPPQH